MVFDFKLVKPLQADQLNRRILASHAKKIQTEGKIGIYVADFNK